MNKCLVLVAIRYRFDSDSFLFKSILIQSKTIRSDILCFHNDMLRFMKLKTIFRCSYYIVTPLLLTYKLADRSVMFKMMCFVWYMQTEHITACHLERQNENTVGCFLAFTSPISEQTDSKRGHVAGNYT